MVLLSFNQITVSMITQSQTWLKEVILYKNGKTVKYSQTMIVAFVQMKIQGQNKQMLAAACQMFMGKSEPEIAQIALETLEGHQRAIIAHLTVEVRVRCFFTTVFYLL